MFAYCLNNPVNMVDNTGEEAVSFSVIAGFAALITCGIYIINTVIFPQFQQALSQMITDVQQLTTSWVEDLEKVITEKMAVSLAKANSSNDDKKHIHHIVAQNDPRVPQARYIMEYLFNHGVNSTINLIAVSSRIHNRLHTNAYHMLVESMIVDAF